MHGPSSEVLRSALRVTVAGTAVVAGLAAAGQPELASSAAFACVPMLLFADFPGSLTERLRGYAGTTAVAAVLLVLATLASVSPWVAVPATFVVTLAIQTATVLGGAVKRARMPLFLSWVLPVTLAGGTDDLPQRLAGWLIGGAVATAAGMWLWPRHGPPALRAAIADAATRLADRLDAAAAAGSGSPPVSQLATEPLAYRPFGTSLRDHELHRCAESLDQATWFVPPARGSGGSAAIPGAPGGAAVPGTAVGAAAPVTAGTAAVRLTTPEEDAALDRATGAAFRLTATLMGTQPPPPDAAQTLGHLVATRDDHLRAVMAASATRLSGGASPDEVLDGVYGVLPLRMRAVLAIEAALHAARSRHRHAPAPYLDGVPGLAPEPGTSGMLTRYVRLLGSALEPGSVWLRASMRVAVGVSVAVLVALLTQVDHGFWVVLGTLSVLRSSAFATGRRYLMAVAGTMLGFLISTVVLLLGGSTPGTWGLWVALPVTIFTSAYAPSAWHFVAGQAAFTTFVVVLFSLFEPVTLTLGLVRVEDVIIGGGLSVVTGAALWPFGSRHRLRAEAAAVLRASAVYLSDGLARAIRRTPADRSGPDRDASLRAQWRADTARRDYAGDRGEDAAGWVPVLRSAARFRLVGDMLERAAEFRSEAPAGPIADRMAPAADDAVAGALLLAAEVESGRPLRTAEPDALPVTEARSAAAQALAAWGGRSVGDAVAWDALSTMWTYVWLRWTHETTARLSAALADSAVLGEPTRIRSRSGAHLG